ncbi:metabotropic glycine receptor-like, partial [Osmerus eperlanus]|uniref:metabotropic glycine receptor-like n=1 Tax=Osmerus eperlanus TaxID=29151 RepID=UPI002E148A8E
CTPLGGHGFVLDQYRCACRRGYYHPSRVPLNGFTGPAPPGEDGSSRCLPCRDGCPVCRDDSPCLARPHGGVRLALASLQGVCMLLTLLSCWGPTTTAGTRESVRLVSSSWKPSWLERCCSTSL